MISEFQTRLAEVLGARLPGPFTGRVHVAPLPEGLVDPDTPALRIGVAAAAPRATGFGGGAFMQVVKGASSPRRVLALTCQVRVEVFPLLSGSASDRVNQMRLLEAAAFELGAADIRDGAAFDDQGTPDPGFLVHKLHLTDMSAPFGAQVETTDPAPRMDLTLELEGWFWPVGQPGVTGVEIQETRIRGVALPVALEAAETLFAGGASVAYTLRVGSLAQPLAASQPGPALGADFQSIVIGLRGGGSLSSVDALPDSTAEKLLINVSAGTCSFLLVPPAEAGKLDLQVSLDNGQSEAGLQFAEFRLTVEEGS